jgi:integrase
MFLKKTNLQLLPSCEIKLKTDRTKTGVQTELFLVKQAIDIVERYKNCAEQESRSTILPYRSNKEVNLQLKYLADLSGITMKLSHHIARHTYRQFLGEAEIEDMAVIKKMMGQTRSNDIDDIYYLVTDNKLLLAKQKFQKFLNENL